MTNVVSLASVKATRTLSPNMEGFTKEDFTNALYEFDFASVYAICMDNPEWKEVILTRSIHTYSISVGILVAQHVKNDDKAAKVLHTAFNKCIKNKQLYFPIKAIPPYAVGYVWCPPETEMKEICELFAVGRFRRD